MVERAADAVPAFPDRSRSDDETQARLRELLTAHRRVVEELDLGEALRQIVEAAMALVHARYGALGVISPDGHLEQFVHVGMPDPVVRRIGHLPRGEGLLGAVIEHAGPIRLPHLAADARASGFPAGHPAMESFLGVPIRVRGEVFGNLYLTDRQGGAFTAEDEEVVGSLAATAAIAIENARLYDLSQQRQRWSTAIAETTAAVLSDEGGDPLDVLTEKVATLVGADLVSVVVPDGADRLRIAAARGDRAEALLGRHYAADHSPAYRAIRERQAIAYDEMTAGAVHEWQPALGPSVAVPLVAGSEVTGALTVSRSPGRPRFTDAELEMAYDFATQASLAIQLSRGRSDRAALARAEDRNRIARDLHDTVIQRLFGSILGLQATAGTLPEPARAKVMDEVENLDSAITEIRSAVFAMSSAPTTTVSVRHRVLDAVGELASNAAAAPRVSFSGPVDLLVNGELADDVVAVVREGLANVIKHAAASRCFIDVRADDDGVEVEIADDGVGPGSSARRSGRANLLARAERRNGTFSLTPRSEGGSRLLWRAPIPEVSG